ncbi:hypothetical protein [Amycolatopsis sp. cmx-4-54]|uniref:hypothetical protein n=1 Tax=Amycolatopsis sp. cmx-4-54 TaxID=2790936 RepID=UPI0039794614
MVGKFHLCRRYVLSRDDPREALKSAELAYVFLAPVFVAEPDRLPPEFVDELRQTGSAERLRRPDWTGPAGRLADLAEAMVPVYVELHRPELITWIVDTLHGCAHPEKHDRPLPVAGGPISPDHGYVFDSPMTHDHVIPLAGGPARAGYLRALAQALQLRSGNRKDLDFEGRRSDEAKALAALEEAVIAAPPDDPGRPVLLVELALANAVNAMLDPRSGERLSAAAVSLTDKALVAAQHEDGVYADVLRKAAQVLRIVAEGTGRPGLAARAAELSEQASTHRRPDRPPHAEERVLQLLDKAGSLIRRYSSAGKAADARLAVRALTEAMEFSQNERVRLSTLDDITGLLAAEVAEPLDDPTLSLLVSLLTKLAHVLGPKHARHPDALAQLGIAYVRQHQRVHDSATVDRAADAFRAAVAATEDSDPRLVNYLSLLGITLRQKARQGATPTERQALAEAVEVLTKADTLMPEAHPGRAALRNALQAAGGLMMLIRYKNRVAAEQPEPRLRSGPELVEKGHWEQVRYRASNDRTALEASADHFRAALVAGGLGRRKRVEALVDLTTALVWLAEQTSEAPYWTEAVERGREALAEPGCQGGYRAEACRRLSRALGMRYQSTNDEEVLEEALALAREDRSLRYYVDDGITDSNRYGRIKDFEGTGNLVSLLLLDHRNGTGRIEEAVRVGREAYRDCPEDHPERPTVLTALADALFKRHQRFGKPEDLAEATKLLRIARGA